MRKHLVKACFLNVEDFTFERQNRLRAAVAAHFAASACAVTLDNEDLAQRWILLRAIRQLARQRVGIERAFADDLAGLAGGFAGAGGFDRFANDAFGYGRMLFKVIV